MALESISTVEVVLGLITTLSSGSTAWLWYDRKRRDKTLDSHGAKIESLLTKQAVHEKVYVNDTQVRMIVRDETLALKESHSELKAMVSALGDNVNGIMISLEVQTEILKNLAERFEEFKNREGK
jgi:hypothetical protein